VRRSPDDDALAVPAPRSSNRSRAVDQVDEGTADAGPLPAGGTEIAAARVAAGEQHAKNWGQSSAAYAKYGIKDERL